MVSNTYCVVFLICFSSPCAHYVASFFGLSILDCPFRIPWRSFIIHRSGEQGLVHCFVGLVQVLLILIFLSVDTAVILTFVLGLNCCRSRLITRKSLLTPSFVTPGFILTSQIYPDFGVRLKTFCNNITNLTRLRRSSHHALYIPKRQSKMTIQWVGGWVSEWVSMSGWVSEWVSECLKQIQQFCNYIMTRTS